MGLQNLTEGLVFGAAYAVGLTGLFLLILIGFILQNFTEGFPIVSPFIGRERPKTELINWSTNRQQKRSKNMTSIHLTISVVLKIPTGFPDCIRSVSSFSRDFSEGELTAPIAIGRDHHDTGSVASPFRETENMKDGSDAIL